MTAMGAGTATTRGHGARSKYARRMVIEALAAGHSIRFTADESGVAEKTIKRWLTDQNFRLAIDEANAELVAEFRRRVIGRGFDGYDTLLALSDADDAQIRLGAARKLAELGVRMVESCDRRATVTNASGQIIEWLGTLGPDPE